MRIRLAAIGFITGICFFLSASFGQTTAPSDDRDPTARRVERPTTDQAATRAVIHVEGKAATQATTQPKEAGDRVSITEHQLKVGDKTLKYTAHAGTLVQKDEAGKAKA